MVNIIVKSYEHFNKSLPNWDTPKGKYIRTKDQYDRAIKESGMISYEESNQKNASKKLKDYSLSNEAKKIIQAAKNSKDKRGNVKLSDRTIDAMVSRGIIGKKIPDYMKLPYSYTKGGFDK